MVVNKVLSMVPVLVVMHGFHLIFKALFYDQLNISCGSVNYLANAEYIKI